MSCVKDMISVIMDGIKDTDMMYWYAKDATDNGEDKWANWFKAKASTRLDNLIKDYDDVVDAIDLKARANNGDDIACAFMDYIENEIEKLQVKSQ